MMRKRGQRSTTLPHRRPRAAVRACRDRALRDAAAVLSIGSDITNGLPVASSTFVLSPVATPAGSGVCAKLGNANPANNRLIVISRIKLLKSDDRRQKRLTSEFI